MADCRQIAANCYLVVSLQLLSRWKQVDVYKVLQGCPVIQREYKEVATYTNGFGAPNYMASYQAYINSYQYQLNYFYNQKLEKGCKTTNNINKFKGDFADNLELYQSFKALYARV